MFGLGVTTMTKPRKQEVTEFLDALYNDGQVDMHEAAPCLEIRFSMDRLDANRFLSNWIDDFNKETD